MMKVTIISAFCPPETGAAPYRILNTAKEIKKGGVDVEIITTLANYPKGKFLKDTDGEFIRKKSMMVLHVGACGYIHQILIIHSCGFFQCFLMVFLYYSPFLDY